MSEKRVLRKLKKLSSRIHQKIESVRDEIEDLEIEFELLQKHIQKLEASSPNRNAAAEDEVEVMIEDDDDEEIDLENTSTVTVQRKF